MNVPHEVSVGEATVLDERYVLGELLGRGGMADVYRGKDLVLERPVAVKVLREVSDESQRRRFVAEARTLASLNHPGLITLLDAGILGDRPYLVMELVEGPTLSSRIQQQPLSEDEVASIGLRLAEALAYAHDLGVVHRDVKPSNVLLCADERVLLADFGIARLVGSSEQHTRTGDAIGSPAYLAPEQVAGEPLTPAVDVFSLGLVLLEALTGTRAYTGSPVEAAIARLNAAPEIPATLGGGWRSLLSRMTQRDPALRPTATEVASTLSTPEASPPPTPAYDELEATGAMDLTSVLPPLTGEPVLPPPPGIETTPRARPSRTAYLDRLRHLASTHLSVLLAVLAALVVVVGIGVWLAVGSGDSTSESPSRVELPSGVPSGLQSPLSDLHRAIEGDGS